MKSINWNTQKRYRPYEQWSTEYKKELLHSVAQSQWRLNYHIQPITGLLNDPNGFSYFNNQWHLFYQAYPFGAVHGVKSWYHLVSDNLIDWQELGLALQPDSKYDSHGVYSGSAFPFGDQLLLTYTGNVRNQEWERHSYQLGALMDTNNEITKISTPFIPSPPAGYTQEFRDPQIFKYEEKYVMLIGAQNTKQEGQILTYTSDDLKEWQFIGPLSFTDKKMGFMIECPNLVFYKGRPILLFCPQGLDKNICHYDNIYPNMYVVAEKFDLATNTLIGAGSLKNLDEGFDVYATQAFNAPDGRVLAISWIGLPEIEYPTDQEGWAHCLSLVKELHLIGDVLFQQPIQESKKLQTTPMQKLKGTSSTESFDLHTNSYEAKLTFTKDAKGTITLFHDPIKNNGLTISFDSKHGKMKVDRNHSEHPFATAFGSQREFEITKQPLNLQIFVDSSVVEIFINQGEQTLTARYFPEKSATALTVMTDKNWQGTLFPLRSMKK